MDRDDALKINLPPLEVDAGAKVCPACLGAGVVVTREDGVERARPCECRNAGETARRLAAVGIPPKYRKCTLGNFFTAGVEGSILNALGLVKNFGDKYPAVDGGLLLMGRWGLGKTHLAVGLINKLAEEKNAECRFCDFAALLAEIRRCYAGGSFDEYALLEPLVNAEVLLLDDLGSMKIRDWTLDILSYVINQRYVAQRLIVATTNYLDTPGEPRDNNKSIFVGPTLDAPDAPRFAGADETLEDRIGLRLRSRLWEMCKTVQLVGDDFRKITQQKEILRYI